MKFAHHYEAQKPPKPVARQAHSASISTGQSECCDCASTRPTWVTRRKTHYTLSTQHPQYMCKKMLIKHYIKSQANPSLNIVPFSHHQKTGHLVLLCALIIEEYYTAKGVSRLQKKIYKMIMNYSAPLSISSRKPTCRLRVWISVFFVKKLPL